MEAEKIFLSREERQKLIDDLVKKIKTLETVIIDVTEYITKKDSLVL